ncbi:hypothetical protein F0562_011359 [Nyssa sinensis]|uniref:non-specific serine/threonine protein kinase n=1 Tax=Nyssa sinensis TaxID=561372 RepID=A0A5J5A294_9ASTE|nr:hypothetical protein F0562_011359 [Nyssa sinensis]
MGINQSLCRVVLFLTLLISPWHLITFSAQPVEYPIANEPNTWINRPLPVRDSAAQVMPILLRGITGTRFVCGFYCDSDSSPCFFAVLIFQNLPDSWPGISSIIESPQVVWSANRNQPVEINATLQLKQDGDLILADADGTLVWSTKTSGKSVSGLNLTEMGNLVLFDRNNAPLWQSFDHPTDSLVPGQMLRTGQKLMASVSASNWSQGLFSLAIHEETFWPTLVAYTETNPPQYYFRMYAGEDYWFLNNNSNIQFNKSGGFGLVQLHSASAAQFMKLGPDGHLRVYEWGGSDWTVTDLLKSIIGYCGYPMACGKYGICSNGQCSCPQAAGSGKPSYFRQTNFTQPTLGCSEITPVSCELSQYHSLLDIGEIYIALEDEMGETLPDIGNCKQACLKNCSCKAAIFRADYSSSGVCFLPSEVLSLGIDEANLSCYISSILNFPPRLNYFPGYAFLKVQNIAAAQTQSPSSIRRRKKGPVATVLASSLGAFFLVFLLIATCFFLLRKNQDAKEVEEDYLDQVPGMLARFSNEELKAMTVNFSSKLGDGGFGSVFEGTLSNGTKVAVKHLDGLAQVKKSFLAEVETIGSIHHVNLVRLIGFCAEKSNRFLVYEYMSNSSLDKWIFHRNRELSLGWDSRRKIILDIAKGLAYLHEECRHKILHLDIKPQNILLDENFNAKVADFGLSKLIDRDQSQVVTTLRGTPGYMAPEWLSSVITEKVDVYSFGVVVLEILCGRKIFDRSQTEEDMYLLSIFKRKAEEEQLLDMIDRYSEDMQLHGSEVVEMMRVGAWCLQSDFAKRPSMSVVVKVLEGLMDVENNLDYSFTNPPSPRAIGAVDQKKDAVGATTILLPSALSGPSPCVFAVLIFQNLNDSWPGISSIIESPQVVWSANRNQPVEINATLQLKQDGDLILADADGTLVWSTKTSGKSVSGLNLTEMGNLVLFDRNNAPLWQSFDHPTDSLVPGQMLRTGQKLMASVSASNWSQGLFSLAIHEETFWPTLVAYTETNPPQYYFRIYAGEDYWFLNNNSNIQFNSSGGFGLATPFCIGGAVHEVGT